MALSWRCEVRESVEFRLDEEATRDSQRTSTLRMISQVLMQVSGTAVRLNRSTFMFGSARDARWRDDASVMVQ